MGLLKEEYCTVCSQKVGLSFGAKLTNGNKICTNCIKRLNLTSGYTIDNVINSTVDELNKRIEQVEIDLQENSDRINSFIPTYQIGHYIWFDDNNKWFTIPNGTFNPSIDNSYIFPYNCIIDYELLEDGHSLSKGGIGRAAVGSLLFGSIGAVVGAATGGKTIKNICTKLQVKISTNNLDRPLFYINLINGTEYKTDSFLFKNIFDYAQEILSKFDLICKDLEETNEKINTQSNLSIADELLKFKQLLDMDAITQEEFNKKKQELLK